MELVSSLASDGYDVRSLKTLAGALPVVQLRPALAWLAAS